MSFTNNRSTLFDIDISFNTCTEYVIKTRKKHNQLFKKQTNKQKPVQT